MEGSSSAATGGNERPWDAIIVGGGPAGLTAALMLGRYRRRTLLFDDDHPRNAATKHINGIPVISGLTVEEFRQRTWQELAAYSDVHRANDTVERASREHDGTLVVESAAGRQDRARCLLLATGVEDICPDDIAGFRQFYGCSIHHCPDCDGYEASGKRIAIVTWGDQAAEYPLEFLNWTRDITVMTHDHPGTLSDEQTAKLQASGMRIEHRRLAAFEGEADALRGIRLEDGGRVACEADYFYIGQRPRSELARQLGCKLTETGHIEQDRGQRTSVPNVFAAGDIAPPDETVAVAIAEGQVAAIRINRALYGPDQQAGGS